MMTVFSLRRSVDDLYSKAKEFESTEYRIQMIQNLVDDGFIGLGDKVGSDG